MYCRRTLYFGIQYQVVTYRANNTTRREAKMCERGTKSPKRSTVSLIYLTDALMPVDSARTHRKNAHANGQIGIRVCVEVRSLTRQLS